jgi:peptidoglycan hydrolase-like protein with peptidoglycan-binding domain
MALIAGAILCQAACGGPSMEERARAAAEEIKKGAADPGEAALDQKLDKALVRQVQQALSARHEYMGEINGVLDGVTVNAVQAFQRSVNVGIPWWTPWEKINETGIIDEPTRAHLLASSQG